MRLLLTGAGGLLGTALQPALAPRHDLVAAPHGSETSVGPALDVTDFNAVWELAREVIPDAVIHAAAYTDVDGCERDPDRAFLVNAQGAWNVAAACAELNSVMIYVSTDFVFDGEKGEPYHEFDRTGPINQYGASKLAGEQAVRESGARFFIVRTQWLFGSGGRSFVSRVLEWMRQGEERAVVSDQIGCPTYTADLARAITDLLALPGGRPDPRTGTYHLTNSGQASWFDLARRTVALAGGQEALIRPIPAAQWPGPARRPRCSPLRNLAWEMQGRPLLRPWDAALQEFIQG